MQQTNVLNNQENNGAHKQSDRSKEFGAHPHESNDNVAELDLENFGETQELFPGFTEKSLCCLTKTSKLRYWCLVMITSPWFERISMLAIIVNCITLGMYQPCNDNPCTSRRCKILEYIDHGIYVFFAIEMFIKIIAMGFVGKKTYLAESWNRLDFFIVLAGTFEYLVATQEINISAIRTFRVLRPLRAINRVPSMRILVMLLLDTLPMLGNVLILNFLVFFIFGIVGVQLWKGLFRQRCFLDLNTSIDGYTQVYNNSIASLKNDWEKFSNSSMLLGNATDEGPTFGALLTRFYQPEERDSFVCTLGSGITTCQEIPPYKNDSRICDGTIEMLGSANFSWDKQCINWNKYYSRCATSEFNIYKGAINFDNIAYAWLTIFQIISLESWAPIMYYIQDVHSFWDWIYFVILIVIGSFFLLNMCLAVIANQFAATKERETQLMLAERRKYVASSSTLYSNNLKGSCWEETIKYILHLIRRSRRRLKRRYKDHKEKKKMKIQENAELNDKPNENIEENYDASSDEEQTTINLNNDKKSDFEIDFMKAPKAEIESMHVNDSVINFKNLNDNEVSSQKEKHSVKFGRFSDSTDPDDSSNEAASHATNSKKRKKRKHKKNSCVETNKLCIFICKFRKLLKSFVDSKIFGRVIFACIFINTFSMGVEHHNQPYWLTLIVEYSNYVFTLVFFTEMVLKLIGYGLIDYIKDSFNVFDAVIVIISLYELIKTLNQNDASSDGGSSVSVLRTFRLLRIFKLIRFLPGLRRQFKVMLQTLDNVTTFFGLLMLFIFIFSILGMNLFGCKFCEEENGVKTCDRKNFDSLLWALVTVFQLLTQEDWNEVLYNGMNSTSHWSAIYFVILLSFGNYVLFNLLVAILVDGFASTALGDDFSDSESDPDSPKKNANTAIQKRWDSDLTDDSLPLNVKTNITQIIIDSSKNQNGDKLSDESDPDSPKKNPMIENEKQWDTDSGDEFMQSNGESKIAQIIIDSTKNQNALVFEDSKQKSIEAGDTQYMQELNGNTNNLPQMKYVENLEKESKNGKCCHRRANHSLYILSEDNPIRNFCNSLITKKWFDKIVLVFIILNAITLAMERPSIKPDSWERLFLTQSNYVFTGIFTLEMLIKIIAKGLIIGENAYLKDGWNVLDCFLVIVSIIDILVSAFSAANSKLLSILRVLRLLRTLRPLRVINRAPGLKLVVQTLITSLKPISNIVLISSTFFIIFGILGVQLFKGKFYHCSGDDLQNVKTKTDCLNNTNNEWVNEELNFDHLGVALMTLFVFATKDGWVNIMYHGLDAVGIDKQPIENYNEWMLLYFILFLLLVGFFVLNMFVGVVVDNFQRCREEQEKEEELKRQEEIARKLEQKRMRKEEMTFSMDYGKPRKMLYDLITNPYFDLAIAAVIGLNIITMSFEYYRMPLILIQILEILNYIFTGIFVIEAIMRIVAMGFIRYIRERWNQLDLFIVILSIAGIILDKSGGQSGIQINPTIIRVMRVLRIARVLKLLRMAKGVRALLQTVARALPQVGNLGSLFLLIFFIFSVLGVELFGKLNCVTEECAGISKYTNFHNFGMSFLALFRVFTGDNWNGIMKDTLRDNALCQDDGHAKESSFCIFSLLAPVFFIFFILSTQFVLLNVVIAVLMKYLDSATKEMDSEDELSTQKEWNELDNGLRNEDIKMQSFKTTRI